MNRQKYDKHMEKALDLFDKERYQDAIEECRTAIKYNNNDVAARLEIAKCYIKMKQLERAKMALTSISSRIGGKVVSRVYYQLWAYIAGEEERYDVALACLKLCQKVNWTYSGFREKKWARSHCNTKVSWKDVVPLMKSYNIPVIFAIRI